MTWTCDNPNFQVVNTNTNAGTYYLVTTWNGTIAAGPETVHLTSSAPDYDTADHHANNSGARAFQQLEGPT